MSKTHEVMFETDGRYTSVYIYEPPMGVRQYVEPIDEVLDLGIDTIIYDVGICTVLLYATEVGERWGHNVDLTNNMIFYRGGQNAASMIERGIDPLRLVCEHAQSRGFQFIPLLHLDMLHWPHGRVSNCRMSDFTTEHPEWQVGPEPDYPEAEHDTPNRLSYAVPEVRADRLAVIREVVGSYPTDGIALNFEGYAPFIARREVAEHTETMTEWVRQIRAACNEAAEAQGRRKRLVVRVAASLSGNLAMGHDLETWIREGLVDTITAMPAGAGFEYDTSGLREVVEAASGTDVKVLVGQDSESPHQSHEVHYAAAVNAYAAGAKGILYHKYNPHPNKYPYSHGDLGRMRFMAYPDLLAHKDKNFRLGPSAERVKGVTFGLTEQLPATLTPGQQGPELTIEVADDVAGKAEMGELWRCELQVMLENMMHYDEVRVTWNGLEVPDEAQRWADWTYQMRPLKIDVWGYRLHVDLTKGMLPKVGRNTLRVDVLKKDEKLIHPISVNEVGLVVEYLPHRHGLRHDERNDGRVVSFKPKEYLHQWSHKATP